TTPDEHDTGDFGADVGGDWKVTHDRVVLICTFEQHGDQLTGSCRPQSGPEGAAVSGSVADRNVRWQFDIALAPGARKQTVVYEGTLDDSGRKMTGTFAIGGLHGEFTAEKE